MSLTCDPRQVESFLYKEADLIDCWRLREWECLFTDDGKYYVHTANLAADTSPQSALFYVADDRLHIHERVTRLAKRTAIAEFPHSRTRHFITNVRITAVTDAEIHVACNLLVHRARDRIDLFAGSTTYRLVTAEEDFRIREKRCVLDYDNLREQSRLSIIL